LCCSLAWRTKPMRQQRGVLALEIGECHALIAEADSAQQKDSPT
jgi:hypothetical protein